MGYFQEANGKGSVIRLVFFIGSLWNMALCSYFALNEVSPTTIITVFSVIEGALLGMKLGQKPMEQKT